MLTVIIPIYNVETYLEKCIQSVLGQSYTDMEILLVNDGSTDQSGRICKQYAATDSRIHYIEKKNGGSGSARNLGLTLAKGDYVTFLDSDDWWDKNYADKMMRYAPLADIVICDLCYVDEVEGIRKEHISEIRMPSCKVQSTKTDADFINKGRTFLCGKVFRKDLFEKHDIWQPTMAINDIPIVPVLIALSKKICRVGEPLYYYLRTREGNTISSIDALKSFGDALTKMKYNFEKFGLVGKYEKALKKMYFSQIRYAIRKAKNAFESGRLDCQSYIGVCNYLFRSIEDFWPDWPNPEGKRFKRSDDPDVNQAILNILFDDRMLVEEEPFSYRVLTKDICMRQDLYGEKENGQVINISKNVDLKGENLWWQMADDLLFCL